MLGRNPNQIVSPLREPLAGFKQPEPERETVTVERIVERPPLLTVFGGAAKLEGKFDIEDGLHIECEVGGELTVGRLLVLGERAVVHADVRTVDAVIKGQYDGTLVATGEVEITATGRASGSIETDSLVIQKGGIFTGTVTQSKETPRERGTRPIYLVEDRRAATVH